MVAICCVSVPGINQATDYSWFIGCGIGLVVYYLLAMRAGVDTLVADREGDDVVVG